MKSPVQGLPPDIPPDNGEAAAALGRTMKQLHRLISSEVMRGMQAELLELEVSFSQMTALHLVRARGRVTVTELSGHTGLSLPAASQLVERLVQRNFVQRQENPENRREKAVSLTPDGTRVLNAVDSGCVRACVATFAGVRPEILHAARATLDTLLGALAPSSPGPQPDATPQEET